MLLPIPLKEKAWLAEVLTSDRRQIANSKTCL